MSAVGGSQRRPPGLLYGAAIAFAVSVSAAAYFALVVREDQAAERARTTANKLKAEIDKATEYLTRQHPDDAALQKDINEAGKEVRRRIPRGPIDITVGSYIEKMGREFHIEDLKWNVEGGIKPPSPPDQKNVPDLLTVDPQKLQGSNIDVVFTSRYKDAVKLIRALSAEENAAPWPIELASVDVVRHESTPQDKTANYKIIVKMTVRYYYQ